MANENQAPAYPESAILIVDGDEALRARVGLLFARAGLDNIVSTLGISRQTLYNKLKEEAKL